MCYKSKNGRYEAEKELQYIFVREIMPVVSVGNMKDIVTSNKTFELKLIHCPFMVLDDSTAVSAGQIVNEWDENEHPTTQSDINIEDEVVYLNIHTPVTHYESADGVYRFCQGDSVFCHTMCLPRTITEESIHKIQEYRKKMITKQLESSRLLLGSRGVLSCYNGHDFSLMKTIADY